MSDQKKVNLSRDLNEDYAQNREAYQKATGVENHNVAPQAAPVYEVPLQNVSLPSKGKVYPVESPLHGSESVDIRSMTARDEDVLTSRALLRQGKALSVLMKNCIMNKSVDPESLLVGDRNAILVALRVSGYGTDYETEVECPECSETVGWNFDLSSVPIIPLGEDPIVEGQNIFEFQLPVSGLKVKYKLLTGNTEREINTIMEKTRKAKGVMGIESNVTTRLFHQVISIDGENDRGKLKRMVDNMPAGDSFALRSHMDKISPNLDMTGEFTCSVCGATEEVDVPLGADFFWPNSRK